MNTGRDFDDRDAAAPGVAIINEAAARKYWPGENPIGQQLRMHIGLTSVPQPRREIVGIGLVGVSLTAVSAAASYLPARRAASIDPVRALRHE